MFKLRNDVKKYEDLFSKNYEKIIQIAYNYKVELFSFHSLS